MADPNIVNPYERIWKTRDLRALETPIELENNTSQFGRGLNAFGKEMQATGYGLAALGAQGLENVIGENAVTSGITDWGIEGYKKAIDESHSGYNAPNVADVANIKGVDDFTDWAGYQLGKGLPMLGTLALSGGVGGAIGRLTAQEGVKQIAKGAVGSAVKEGVETKALQATEGQIITKAMQETAAKALRDRAVAGAMTGGYAGSFGLEGGLAFGEQVDAGVKPEDAVKSAIAVGGINGALEFLPFYKVAKDIGMGQYAKKSIAEIIKNDAGLSKKAVALATTKELGGRATKGGLEGAGAEGITEGLQELTSIAGLRWAKQDPLFANLTDDDWNRVGNAMAAGALVGGVAAGAGATLKGPKVTDSATTDTNTPSIGTAAPVVKTREQEIETALAKLTTNLEAAKAVGDTKTIQELQQIKELYDVALGKQKPVIEPTVETPPNEQITQEQPIPGATETQAQAQPPLEMPAGPEGTSGVQEEGTGAETREAMGEVVQPRSGESIQLKRGEEIVLTPDGTSVRTTPTQEEVEALRQRMGPRPEKQTTQPIEEAANAQEVQAQTETQVEPSAIPAQTELEKQAIAIGNNKGKLKERLAQAKSVLNKTTATLFKDATYDFDNKRLVSKYGNYALQWKIRNNPEEPSSYANQQTNAGVVSLINIGNTSTQVKGTSPLYSKPIEEIKSPNEGITTEATMEEFEAVRRQFQERQSQTPFKKWFGAGTPNITATKEGEPITLYHGTNNPAFYEWDSTKAGEASGHPTSGLGFFMTADQGAAARYGNNLLALHAKINNPYILTDADLTRIETPQDAVQLRKKLMDKGYDGAVVTAPGASPYVIAFQANQIKLKSNTAPTSSPDMRYSKPLQGRETPAPFYSALERAAQEVKQQKAPASQWLGTLDTMVKKGIVKQEELDWSGTKEWLQEQKEPVTKEALLQHVRDNTLSVQETELKKYTKENLENDPNYVIESYDSFGKTKWLVRPANNPDDALVIADSRDSVITKAINFLNEENQPRNTKWTLPGGENQRELVLTVPSIEPFNTDDTTHYGDVEGGKAVAWVRFNDRVDENGNKTLFIEEIQSKRHQEGKEKGYQPSIKERIEQRKIEDNLFSRIEDLGITVYGDPDEGGRVLKPLDVSKLPDNIRVEYENYVKNTLESRQSNRIPDAPFKQTIAGSGQTLSGWAGLAFKRMLRYAAENGYDKIAWTTGEQQAKRYNLAQSISKIVYTSDGYFQGYDRGGRVVMSSRMDENEVSNYIGKELTNELFAASVKNGERTVELAEDKVIGGEGMKGFYDRLLPNEINKYVKKWGAKVDKTQMEFGNETADVHSVEVTLAMRDSVMQGQPLFSKEAEKNPQQPDNTSISLQDIQSNIDSVMGQGWLQRAQELGLVEVIEGAGPNGEAGSWAGDRIRLYTNTMPKNGSPAGVLLHEGKHVTFEDVLGNSLPEYVKDLHTLADNSNKVAQDAITHAAIAVADVLGIKHNLLEGGTKADLRNLRTLIEQERPGLLAEEELAYFVQYGADAQTGTGFWKRLVNQIKAWFAQTRLGQRMKELGIGFELTDIMAVEWAKMGLNRSLAELRQAERQMESAKQKPASVRLGSALEKLAVPDALYSMGIREITQQLWNDPTDIRPEIVNKPGILQKWRADFIDFFAEMEKKSKDIYDTYSLLRSKKAARIEQARQEYFLPLRKLIAESPWTAQEVGDMAAARHIKVDNVNTRLAQRASYGYTKELLKALSTTKRKELMQARINVKAGKMPDGSVYLDANGNPAQMSARTKQQLMFDLMNQYSQYEITGTDGIQVLREEWELFKDAAAGFSDGGVGSTKVRTVDNVLKAADKDRAKFNQIMTLFDAANRHTLELLEDGELITVAEHARLLLDKSAYAPLRRESYKVDEEVARLFQRAGQGGSKQIATRSGTENLSEPTLVLQNALAAIEAAAAAAERNLANKELYKVVVKDQAGWKPWFTIVEKEKYVTHDEDGFLQEKNATASNRADITLINDGKKLVIRPNMHNERAMGFVRAVNNLDAQVVNGPMKVLGWLNQIVRWVNVSASPIFLMTNAFKDPFTALYNIQATEAEKYTKEIFSPKTYKDSFRALKKVFMDGNRDPNDPDVQWVERWELAGGRTSFVETLRDMDETWKSFDAQVSRRKGTVFGINVPSFKSLMQAKDKWIDGIENFNILFENVMRFSTFKVLMEKGAVSEAQAARISQDLTTNFTRRGYKTQALGTWWLFFNASVQGNYQVLRNLMSSKKVQAAVGGTVVMALLLDLLGRAVDDDWDKIPEWDKERFIILPIKVAGDFVRIPAPWVYNVAWRTGGLLGEMLSQVKTPQDGLLDIAAMVTTTFNPLGKPGSLAQAISPTGFDPFMQIIENKNFAGNPIGPEGFPGTSKKANSELMWSSTPPGYQSFARFVNEATGGSAVESGAIDLRPGDYQILVNFLTGSLGRFMADTTFGVKEALDKDFEGMRDIPVAKEFFSDPYDPLKSQKYHTNIAGIYGAHKLEQMYIKGPERDLIKLQEVRENRGKELQMYSQAQDVERQLKSLRVRLRAAQNQGDTAREKELRDKIGKIQERFNNVYRQKMR